MKAYLLYKEKSVKEFKRFATASGNLFDKYRPMATSFIRYAGSDLDKNLANYGDIIARNDGRDLSSINLEEVFPTQYKWLISNISLKNSTQYLKSLQDRMDEFQGKEDNLKLVLGILFIKFVLITKIVETYLASASSFVDQNVKLDSINLNKIGIGKSVLKYFDDLQDISDKTIDDWLNYVADPVECKYFYSSMKRILTILVGDDSSIK